MAKRAPKYSYPTVHEYYKNKTTLSPAVARALDLWASGAVKTKKAAAEALGISPITLGLNSRSPAGMAYMDNAHTILQDRSIETSVLIEKLSRRGIEVLGTMMEDADKEDIRFRAAQDLADRGSKTSKIHKIQAETFTVAGRDVAALAEAMVKGAQLKEMFPDAAAGKFIKAGSDESSG